LNLKIFYLQHFNIKNCFLSNTCYTNENENASGKELSCGYPCFKDKKPDTFIENGVEKQYMCGSITFPTIKTPPRYAVYQIYEKM
jgi:hypothetical protein